MGQSPGSSFHTRQSINLRERRHQWQDGASGAEREQAGGATPCPPVQGVSGSHQGVPGSPLPQPVRPQPAAAGKLSFLPRHPVCGRGLCAAVASSAPGVNTPLQPSMEGRGGAGLSCLGQLLTPPACPCQLRCPGCFASTHVTLGTPILQRYRAAPGQQLSNQTSVERSPHGGGTQRTQRRRRDPESCRPAATAAVK